MPYIDLAGLSRYASRQKERLERDCALLRDMQWTRSEKAGAVSLWPAGGTELKPSVDFLFTETLPASGDKSPTNPSTITGVSEVTVKHRTSNLLYPIEVASGTTRDVSWSSNGDGSFTFNGTVSSNSDAVAALWSFSDIPNGAYRLKMKGSELGTHPRLVLKIEENGSFSYPAFTENSSSYVAVTVTDTRKLRGIYFRFIEGYTFNNITVSPYLVLGDEGYDIPLSDSYTIPLGSTYYGGTIDVASGVMTVTHRMFTINGTTAMSTTGYAEGTDAYRIGYYLPDKERTASGSVVPPGYACDTLPIVMNPTPSGSLCWGLASASTACYIRFPKELIGAGDDLPLGTVRPLAQAWLAQHPVTVAYPMVETNYQTVQLDPVSISALAQSDKYTPRLNTVYTDAQSVQVGYIKSPIREEYELTQAIAAQGGNV